MPVGGSFVFIILATFSSLHPLIEMTSDLRAILYNIVHTHASCKTEGLSNIKYLQSTIGVCTTFQIAALYNVFCWFCKTRLQIGLMYDVQFLICRNVDKKFQTNKLFLRVYHSKLCLFGET